MGQNNCEYTTWLVQKIQNKTLDKIDQLHLASCPDCQLAFSIRKAFLEELPGEIPDLKERIWQQHTIHQVLKRERQRTGWQLGFSMAIEFIAVGVIGVLLFLLSRSGAALPSWISGNKITEGLNELWVHPVIWISILSVIIAGIISIRFLKTK